MPYPVQRVEMKIVQKVLNFSHISDLKIVYFRYLLHFGSTTHFEGCCRTSPIAVTFRSVYDNTIVLKWFLAN